MYEEIMNLNKRTSLYGITKICGSYRTPHQKTNTNKLLN